MNKNHHIILVAGEASGDMHGAYLVEELKKLNPSLTFSGLGGRKMMDSGVKIDQDLTRMAVVGFWEVLKHYSTIKKAFDLILAKIHQRKPSAIILIDYPGFNLRLAKKINKQDVKVIYYISPQVWAWKASRVELVRQYIDQMLVLFKFEKSFYARYGIDVSFVGHPLTDTVVPSMEPVAFLKSVDLQEYKTTIGLLPGSREKEVQRLLPEMLKAAQILKKEFPMLQFLIVKAETIDAALIEHCLNKNAVKNIRVAGQRPYDAIHACDFCVVASGTATLEAAILGKPMVILYKTSLLTYLLAKIFVKIPHIGLVNIVAEKAIVPELIQDQATPKNIAGAIKKFIVDEEETSRVKCELSHLRNILDTGGASRKAAEKILKVINPPIQHRHENSPH